MNNEPADNINKKLPHTPVMILEVLEYLHLKPGQVILDCTVGSGGHAGEILKKIEPNGLLIGIDKDQEILLFAKQHLKKIGSSFKLFQADYIDVDEVLRQAKIDKVHGVLLDLGVSSLQLDKAERGFSFTRNGPLDMRMDQSKGITAQDLIHRISENNLAEILRKYGEERWSKRIARAIVREEKEVGLTTTKQLTEVIERVVPKGKSKIHPATRVFQALRIAVNNELRNLDNFLNTIHTYMWEGACIVVISFHSLEDRIIKRKFNEYAGKGIFRVLTRKPVCPSKAETMVNVRSRSAKLRAAERI